MRKIVRDLQQAQKGNSLTFLSSLQWHEMKGYWKEVWYQRIRHNAGESTHKGEGRKGRSLRRNLRTVEKKLSL